MSFAYILRERKFKMKKLKACKDCGKEVSKSAKRCPNCGKKLKKSKLYYIFLVIVFLIVITALNDNNDEKLTEDNKLNKNVELTVINFENMEVKSIKDWCAEKKVNCTIKEEYSNDAEKGTLISQSVVEGKKVFEGSKIDITYSLGKEPTLSQKNAIKKAENYLDTMAFSKSGLIKQLKFEGFTEEESTFALENITVDWNKQAIKKAENYLDTMAFSKSGLIKQLKFEGFTEGESTFALENITVDWNEQAAKKAESYLDTMAFSRSGLINQLKFEGFTTEQATYGVNKVGL